jgi:hypothetical protein
MPIATYTILVLALTSERTFSHWPTKYRKAVLLAMFIGTTATQQEYE